MQLTLLWLVHDQNESSYSFISFCRFRCDWAFIFAEPAAAQDGTYVEYLQASAGNSHLGLQLGLQVCMLLLHGSVVCGQVLLLPLQGCQLLRVVCLTCKQAYMRHAIILLPLRTGEDWVKCQTTLVSSAVHAHSTEHTCTCAHG